VLYGEKEIRKRAQDCAAGLAKLLRQLDGQSQKRSEFGHAKKALAPI